MSKAPVTVKPDDGINDAIWKMERGHFRHLPVVDEAGKLIGMLTDRDVRFDSSFARFCRQGRGQCPALVDFRAASRGVRAREGDA